MTIAINGSTGAAFSQDNLSGAIRENAVDRWIYVFTAATFIALVLVGFVPDSMGMVAAVQAGITPPLPIVLHVHAVLMGSLLLLLLAQTILVAIDKRDFHVQLGIAAMVLMPAVLVTGVVLVPTMYHFVSNAAQNAPPQARPQFQFLSHLLENVFLAQVRIGLTFAVCMGIALQSRKSDPGTHKRLIILAIATALPAAFDRMHWLPTTMPNNLLGPDIYTVLAFSPMLIWDLIRNHKLHRAYMIWAAIFIPISTVIYALWDKPWWHATARQIMGV